MLWIGEKLLDTKNSPKVKEHTKMLRRNITTQSLLMNSLRGSAGLGELILPLSQKRMSIDTVADPCDLSLDLDKANRRTIGLLPMPANRQEHELAETDTLRLQNLLLSIESRQISCCIRVFSETKKSRSALLIYRGRLIGSIFGSKGLHNQLAGKEAFSRIMAELVTPGNVIDCYRLSDEMVLASASMFHGGLNTTSSNSSAMEVYPTCANRMITNKRTGCIVVKGGSEFAVCITYFFEGRIIGVYSFAEGWLTPTQTAALNTIESVLDAEVWIAVLPVAAEAAEGLTESLTGLDFSQPAKT